MFTNHENLTVQQYITGHSGTDPEINQGGGWLTFQVGSLMYVCSYCKQDVKRGFSSVGLAF